MIKLLMSLALMLYVQYAYGATWNVQSKEYSIETDKIAHIEGYIDLSTQVKFKVDMIETKNLPGARLIIIDSPGGEVDIGLDIMKTMEDEKKLGVKEVCLVIGQASSMAFNFLTHCDVRLAVKGSSFLVHKVETVSIDMSFHMNGMRKTAHNLRIEAARLDALDEQFRVANAQAMGMDLPDYDFCANKETVWHTGMLHVRKYLTGVAIVK